MESPGYPWSLHVTMDVIHFLLPPFRLTSFNFSESNVLRSFLSSFDKSRHRVTLLKQLSRIMLLVCKLPNFISKGHGFGESSTFLPILNISMIFFFDFSACYFFQELKVLFLLIFQHLSSCRLWCCTAFFVSHCWFLFCKFVSDPLWLIFGLSQYL